MLASRTTSIHFLIMRHPCRLLSLPLPLLPSTAQSIRCNSNGSSGRTSPSSMSTPSSMLYDVYRVYPKVREGITPPSCIVPGEVTVRDLLVPRSSSKSNSVDPSSSTTSPSSSTFTSSSTSSQTPPLQRNSHDIHVRDVLSLSIQSRQQQKSKAGSSDFTARKEHLIIPRGDALLLKLGNFKAVCWRDEALLFDSHRPDVQRLATELDDVLQQMSPHSPDDDEENKKGLYNVDAVPDEKTRSASPPTTSHFELIVLESVLRDICDSWHRRLRLYRPVVSGLLAQAGLDADAEAGMHQLVPLKDGLEQFNMEVDGARRCITDLLKNDDDMLSLLLTERHFATQNNKKIDPNLHDIVELLLEDYSRQLHAIHQEIEYLLRGVKSKQEVVALSLDSYRNRLISMNVHLAVASVCLSVCSCTAGFLGMNVPNGFESADLAFGMAVGGSAVAAAGVLFASRSYLQGGAMRRMVDERARRVRAVSRVLSEMGSLEYAIRHLIDRDGRGGGGGGEGGEKSNSNVNETNSDGGGGDKNNIHSVSKEELKALIEQGRGGRRVSDGELDFIFSILDESGDGMLQKSEFLKLNQSTHQASSKKRNIDSVLE